MSDTGHFRAYSKISFAKESLGIIAQANTIIQGYEGQGYSLTLRRSEAQLIEVSL